MTDSDNQNQSTEYDSPWKEILKAYFKDFLAFFLPDAHNGIDWHRAPEFLDKELDRITKEAQAKNRRVDLLVKVWLLNGDELWVLIHVEIQGDRDAAFAERMYTCQHRAYDLHRKPVVGLAILADEEPGWRVAEYRRVVWGSEVIYRFNTVKLLDYLDRLPELEASDNPFAIVTLAHLTGKQTRNKPDVRYQEKKRVTRSLYRRGFDRQKVIDLYRFIDWVLNLSNEADNRFWQELSNFEENQQMPYITSVERIGEERGRLIGIQMGRQEGRMEGRQEGEATLLLRLLKRRFGEVPEWVHARVVAANLDTLEVWSERLFDADSLSDVFQ